MAAQLIVTACTSTTLSMTSGTQLTVQGVANRSSASVPCVRPIMGIMDGIMCRLSGFRPLYTIAGLYRTVMGTCVFDAGLPAKYHVGHLSSEILIVIRGSLTDDRKCTLRRPVDITGATYLEVSSRMVEAVHFCRVHVHASGAVTEESAGLPSVEQTLHDGQELASTLISARGVKDPVQAVVEFFVGGDGCYQMPTCSALADVVNRGKATWASAKG